MFLNVQATGAVTLEEARNFRSFKVVVAIPDGELETARRALSTLAILPDRETAWIFEQALRDWPDFANDPAWQDSLTAMIDKASPYGWVDDANRTIKAHVEWTA